MNESPDSESQSDAGKPAEVESSASGVSRRRFLQSAALVGATAVVPSPAMGASLAGTQPVEHAFPEASGAAKLPNPIVPDFQGKYGGSTVPDFEIPKRPMGSTGLKVSILGLGGYHLGTVSGQVEVNNMVAKALDHGINFFDNA